MAPPTTMHPTKMKGSSIAIAFCREKFFPRLAEGGISGAGLSLDSKGIVSEPRERLRIQPRRQGYKQRRAEDDGLGAAHERRGGVAGLFEPSVDDHAEIVVERGNDIECGENREHGMMRFDEREKNEVLAHETCRGRNAGERKHEDKEKEGGGGAAMIESVKIVEFIADQAALAEHDNNSESAGGHEHVGDKVVDDSREAGFVAGDEAEKNVADVRDGRVGEEALDVGLRKGRKIAPSERGHGDAPYQAMPEGLGAKEDPDEEADEQREAGRLRGHADVSGDGCGRAFVDVGCPLMEWDGCDLKEETSSNGDKGENDEPVGHAAASDKLETTVECSADIPDAGAAGKAIEQGETVGKDPGAEAAEEKIFESGFVGTPFAAKIARENVQAEGHSLEAKEHHDQVGAGGHEHHADAGEKQKRIVFAFLLALQIEIAHGKKDHQRGGGEKDCGEEERVAVNHDGVLEAEEAG